MTRVTTVHLTSGSLETSKRVNSNPFWLPPAVQWPKASRGQGEGEKPPVSSKKEQEADRAGSSGFGEPPRPTTSLSHRRVLRLQTALNALGDDNNPEAKVLCDALKKAQQEVTTAPVGVQFDAEPRTDC